LQTLPSAVRAAVHAAQLHNQHRERGNIRWKNDCTIDSRNAHFATWLGRMGYDNRSIYLIGTQEGTLLLEGFLHMVATCPDAHLPSATTQLQGSMLLLYLKAAALWLQTELNVTIHVVSPTMQKILPLFWDVIAQAFKWGTLQPKWEP